MKVIEISSEHSIVAFESGRTIHAQASSPRNLLATLAATAFSACGSADETGPPDAARPESSPVAVPPYPDEVPVSPEDEPAIGDDGYGVPGIDAFDDRLSAEDFASVLGTDSVADVPLTSGKVIEGGEGSQRLVLTAGMTTDPSTPGRRLGTAGGVIDNSGPLAAYDIRVAFDLVDADGFVTDTEWVDVPYVPAGGRRYITMANGAVAGDFVFIDFDLVAFDFAPDAAPGSPVDGAVTEPPLEILNPAFERLPDALVTTGKIVNTRSETIGSARVSCIFLTHGKIVGAHAFSTAKGLEPGHSVSFTTGTTIFPTNTDDVRCDAHTVPAESSA